MWTRSRNRITQVNRPGECLTTWTISARTPTSWRSRWPGSRTAGFFCGTMTIRLSSRVAASIARTEASRPISSGPTWPGGWTSVRNGMTGYWPAVSVCLLMVPAFVESTDTSVVVQALAQPSYQLDQLLLLVFVEVSWHVDLNRDVVIADTPRAIGDALTLES